MLDSPIGSSDRWLGYFALMPHEMCAQSCS